MQIHFFCLFHHGQFNRQVANEIMAVFNEIFNDIEEAEFLTNLDKNIIPDMPFLDVEEQALILMTGMAIIVIDTSKSSLVKTRVTRYSKNLHMRTKFFQATVG